MTTKYRVERSAKFKRDFRKIRKRGYNTVEFDNVVHMLANGLPLPPKYHDHPLRGDRKGSRECHITPDWLLVYRIYEDVLILLLQETGTHSDLF